MEINGNRLWSSLMDMAEIGATPNGGCNRQALTEEDREGRDLFCLWAQEAGCEIRIDNIGNLFARHAGTDAALDPVLIGSHLDTQATGGKFDGVYGVLAGLEVVRTLNDTRTSTPRPVELVVWTNEEGCRFSPAMLGSGVVAGAYDLDFAYGVTDKAGISLGEALDRCGYRGNLPATPPPCHAIYEAHIEQGPILEHADKTIGVVSGIQGAYWVDITLTGSAVHAGPTPMASRKDPWFAAAPLIQDIFDLSRKHEPWARATIGDIQVAPGARNTVPESVKLSVDIRHPEISELNSMYDEIIALTSAHTGKFGLTNTIEQVWHMPPTSFDQNLIDIIRQSAEKFGYSHMNIVSGAGHDSLHTASFAPTAMIFIPCENGISHNEAENIDIRHSTAGCNVLLEAVLNSANGNAGK